MKKIYSLLTVALTAIFCFTSCETYTVDEPEHTAVSDFDGEWICKATNQADPSDQTLFVVQITNTTFNDADKIWVTIADLDDSTFPYLDAVRFLSSCNNADCTFSCQNSSVEIPRTCRNPYYEQSYYTYQYRAGATTASASWNGKIIKNVDSPSGYKCDKIEFTYQRVELDGTVLNYNVTGTKNTGWAEDLKEYAEFAEEKGWW